MKKIVVTYLCVLGFLMGYGMAHSQTAPVSNSEQKTVDYQNGPAVDLDVDGLTDEGEKQIYKTDPTKADTDGDGWSDGVEVLSGSNPLDKSSFVGDASSFENAGIAGENKKETPWAWYISRSSGLLAFALLYLSMFLGLTIRIPSMRKLFAPLYSLQWHCFIALHATLLALLHGVVLVLDKFTGFDLIDVLVPFSSHYEPGLVALGILGFYLMIMLTVTSYARKTLSYNFWRSLHFTNIGLYIIVVIHALYLGTDIKIPLVKGIFLGANVLLALLIVLNIVARIQTQRTIDRKRAQAAAE